MVACERLCIPFDENKMVDVEVPFLGSIQLLHLDSGLDEGDIAEVTFVYLNITSANFQPDPYSHLAGYRTL